MALRLVFMGTPDFAVPTLLEIVGRGHDVVAVYTRAPQPAGRGMARSGRARSRARPSGSSCRFSRRRSLKDPDAADAMRAHGADAAVVVAYGLILPKPILDAFPLGCFNLHASLLPRWRGAAPIHRAIMAGDKETGVMVMKMDEGLDTGPIAMAERVAIGADMTTGDLHDELAPLGAKLMLVALGALERGIVAIDAAAGRRRDLRRPRSTRARPASIGRKPWNEVHDHCRGLSPFPGAWFELAGRPHQGVAHHQRRRPRRSRARVLDDRLTIACGEGAVRIVELQRAGGSRCRRMNFCAARRSPAAPC